MMVKTGSKDNLVYFLPEELGGGMLISALFGWYVTALFHLAGYPWLVVIWYVVTEVSINITE